MKILKFPADFLSALKAGCQSPSEAGNNKASWKATNDNKHERGEP
jgi:hypothetical protein